MGKEQPLKSDLVELQKKYDDLLKMYNAMVTATDKVFETNEEMRKHAQFLARQLQSASKSLDIQKQAMANIIERSRLRQDELVAEIKELRKHL